MCFHFVPASLCAIFVTSCTSKSTSPIICGYYFSFKERNALLIIGKTWKLKMAASVCQHLSDPARALWIMNNGITLQILLWLKSKQWQNPFHFMQYKLNRTATISDHLKVTSFPVTLNSLKEAFITFMGNF